MPAAPSAIWVFVEGIATVLTPCNLSVLPAMLSGSVGSRLRSAATVTGMSSTFTLMGIFISAVASFTFFTGYLRQLSILFITGMGVVMLVDKYLKTLLFPYFPNIKGELLNRHEKYLRLYG